MLYLALERPVYCARVSVLVPWQGAVTTELTELRTYVGVWPEGERIPYDGAIPFAIE